MAARTPTPASRPEDTSFTAGSILPGGSPGAGFGAYGGVPNIPNPLYSAGQAIGGDIGQFPAYSNLANMYNLANYNTQAQEVAGTPGFSSVQSLLGGQIPSDILNQLTQGAAERGIATGTTGSPNSNAAFLQSLGLTSLDLQNLGQQQYGALLGHFPMAAPFDMQAFMTSPEQYQAAQTAANVNAAAPNPQMAAEQELQDLLKAIEAGKGSIPGLGPGRGGTTTTPGGGPNSTNPPPYNPGPVFVTGGGGGPPTPPPPNTGPTGTGPGTGSGYMYTGGTGPVQGPPLPPDWTLGGTDPNVSSFMDTLFGNPNYQDSQVTGMGLDPVLNALFNTAPPPHLGTGPAFTGAGPQTQPNTYYDFLTGGQTQYQTPSPPPQTWSQSDLNYYSQLFGMSPDEVASLLGGDTTAASSSGAQTSDTSGGVPGYFDPNTYYDPSAYIDTGELP